MSILTGQPTGRVVFVQFGGNKVTSLARANIERLTVTSDGADNLIKLQVASHDREHVVRLSLDRDPDESYAVYGARCADLMFEVRDSILAEDADVVWTEVKRGAGWTRTPDKERLR